MGVPISSSKTVTVTARRRVSRIAVQSAGESTMEESLAPVDLITVRLDDRPRFSAAQKCQQIARRLTGLAPSQQHRILANWSVQVGRHSPGRAFPNLAVLPDLRQGDETYVRVTRADELKSLGDVFALHPFGLGRFQQLQALQNFDRRRAIGGEVGIGQGEFVE